MIMLCSGHYFRHYFVRYYKPSLIGVFAEFERYILSERVKAGELELCVVLLMDCSH